MARPNVQPLYVCVSSLMSRCRAVTVTVFSGSAYMCC